MKYGYFVQEKIDEGKKALKTLSDEELEKIDERIIDLQEYFKKVHNFKPAKSKEDDFYYFLLGLITSEGFDERYHLYLLNEFEKQKSSKKLKRMM